MKFITSCPKCDTHFLINDELIRAYHGKVQCGSCQHIFNAKTRLTEVADETNSAEEYRAIIEEIVRQDEIEEIIIGAETNHKPGFSFSLIDTPLDAPDTSIVTEPDTVPDNRVITSADIFIDKDKTYEKARKSRTDAILGIVSLLLMLSALMQTVYYSRVKLAAEFPQFKPLLLKACGYLGCTIDLPRNLDLITIGDSDMQEDDNYASVINFSSSLKNSADYSQVYPNIELALTDLNDQVVIKKLLSPKDYLTTDKKIEDGLPANEVTSIRLALDVRDAKVSGYRMLLFY